ncbi:MAG: UvrD-helicase domain-containing protein [Bacilli bacterium]|jgi:DNA helicase-2/ATP-dependent DNA helicase PcrA|nr:UvrD-helicase domain-containing protein [Bacilli bacterium]
MDLSNFNTNQRQAIISISPYIKVIAGAGSGKTSVLTNRIVYLIKEKQVNPKKILAITFTNKAANEMKQRVLNLLNIDKFDGMIATFHGFCLRILKEDINLLGYSKNFNIVDGDDQKRILKEINKTLNYDSTVFVPNSIINYISNKKNDYGFYYDDELSQAYDEFYVRYQAYLKENDSVDFDDLILLVNRLFACNKDILDKWRYRYHYLHVDEFQDINKAQYQLIKYLGKELNVFVVGDPDQNIYSWRGACLDFILNFEKDFYPSEVIKLEYNYRSSKHILDVANSLIVHNKNRIDKVLKPTIDDKNIKVLNYVGRTDENEADFVVNEINNIISEVEGVNYQDFAILYRANYISRVFESKLLDNNIPYQIIGGQKFFERKEIKDMIAYLKLLVNKDNLSLLRIINTPKRKIGEVAISKVVNTSNNLNVLYFDCLKDHLNEIGLTQVQKNNLNIMINELLSIEIDNVNPGIILEKLFAYFDVINEYKYGSDEYISRKENIQELINYAKSSEMNVTDFIQSISLDSTHEDGNDDYKVNLLSVHNAKGLEFKYVFVVFFVDGIFPSKYAFSKEGLEEERRLAYVAFTRAKKQLFLLSHIQSYDYSNHSSSIFLKEIEQDLLDKAGIYAYDNHLVPDYSEEKVIENKEVSSDFQVGENIEHPKFKIGNILAIDGDILTIAFEHGIGIKYINKNFIRKL